MTPKEQFPLTGAFDINRPPESTGRSHMLDVKCTLCGVVTEVDMRKITGDAVHAIELVAGQHVCTPRVPVKLPDEILKIDVPVVQEAGDIKREDRLRGK